MLEKVDEESPYPDVLISIGAAGTTPTDVYGQVYSPSHFFLSLLSP